MLTHCRLTVEQVQGLLGKFRDVESPYLRDFLRTLFLEELCLDWLEMRAAQADEIKPESQQ